MYPRTPCSAGCGRKNEAVADSAQFRSCLLTPSSFLPSPFSIQPDYQEPQGGAAASRKGLQQQPTPRGHLTFLIRPSAPKPKATTDMEDAQRNAFAQLLYAQANAPGNAFGTTAPPPPAASPCGFTTQRTGAAYAAAQFAAAQRDSQLQFAPQSQLRDAFVQNHNANNAGRMQQHVAPSSLVFGGINRNCPPPASMHKSTPGHMLLLDEQTILLQQQQQLMAAQQRVQLHHQAQKAQAQQQQQNMMQHLHDALARSQQQQHAQQVASQQLSEAQTLTALSNLWQQQQQAGTPAVAAAAAAAKQQQAQQLYLQQQVQQHQQQTRARQNMAALAHLTPAQLDAINSSQALVHLNSKQLEVLKNSSDPSAARALLQAQLQLSYNQPAAPAADGWSSNTSHAQLQAQAQALLQAHARQQQQQQARVNQQAADKRNAGAEALLMALHQQQQQRQAAAAAAAAEQPKLPGLLNNEQRIIALERVAAHLVQNNISVDRAIHSGIMGGMSVTDVKYIIEVHDAHQARAKQLRQLQQMQQAQQMQQMQQAMAAAGQARVAGTAAATAAAPAMQLRASSGSASPAPSIGSSSSAAGSEAGEMFCAGSSSGGNSAAPSVDTAAGPGERFNALSYDFFGVPDGKLEDLDRSLGELESPGWLCDHSAGSESSWGDEGCGSAGAKAAVAAADSLDDDIAARLCNLDLGSGFF